MSDWVKDDWDEDEEAGSKLVVKESWEDDNIKESWEDEEDTKENWEEDKPKPSKPAPKESKKAPAVTKEVKEMTEEEKKEAQLKSDYEHTQELFGLSKSLDEMSLKTKEEYQDFIARLYARVNVYSGSSLYVEFLEELFKTLCKGLNSDSCKKLANQMRILYEQKSNEEKQAKSKDQKPKGKSKARIKMEFDRVKADFDTFVRDDILDDGDDDFM